jgi:hypothetical protein
MTGMGGVLAVSFGGATAFAAVGDAVHHRSGGMVGVIVALALLAAGVCTVTWAFRAWGRVASEEREQLRSRGLDDGLPMGAFLHGRRVGLEASDHWLVLGTVLAGMSLLVSVAGGTDPQVGWRFGIAFGMVGFLPAAVCLRLGVGTRLWLTPEGVERSRWPRRTVRWSEVNRVVPLEHGNPTAGFDAADGIELQLPPVSRGWRRLWGVNDFTIRCQFLEISANDLLPLIQERLHLPQDGV